MKRAVITGGTGMIASALAKVLNKSGVEAFLIVRPNSARLSNIEVNDNIKIIECDLKNLSQISEKEIGKCDAFFHFGWDGTYGDNRNNTYLQNQNITSTLDAVTLAAKLGCEVFVGAGSQAEYGQTDEILSADTPIHPENGYGIAKYAAGKLSHLLCSQLGIRHCWVRILSIYGENDSANTLIMYCISQLLKKEKLSLTKCDQIWDYLYCGDAAEALLAIGLSGQDGKTYCLGSGKAQPLKQYVETIRDIINPEIGLGFGEKPYYPNQAMYLQADINDLVKDTGFTPKTTFAEGIKKTIDWYKLQQKK